MRLAKRYTVMPGLVSRPPRQTPASMIIGWPSWTPALSAKVATSCGCSSFMMPSRRLYSPTGPRQSEGGSENLTSRTRCASCTICFGSSAVGVSSARRISFTSLAASCDETHASSLARNLTRSFSFDERSSEVRSSTWSDAGWCFTVCGTFGIESERRAYSRVKRFERPPSADVNARPKRAYLSGRKNGVRELRRIAPNCARIARERTA